MFTQPASALNPQRLRIFPSPTLIYSVYKFEYKEKEKQTADGNQIRYHHGLCLFYPSS